ncbi:MAG: isoaspartyl peptidase/L-asparaginase, partial [Candidatus Eisenbacteria bacterium]|nr:isoaspartyl peptidase/L-asparaginase [Candidatus Eisenbacteria bacterium]
MEKEEQAAKEAKSRMRSLIVHGGAWQIPDEEIGAHREGLRRALARGVALLRAGRPALDVVVETVAVLEDDPTFDAGRGSVLNLDGRIEMDAAVMEAVSYTHLRAHETALCISVSYTHLTLPTSSE